ncbi:zinc ABC transporter ATP-binding protein AztA [Prosthecomicrobium sp. N25]|uniref:zinc ABC transporter ATP-binding protein AztA n=1 Tax=Prosthecomicrobium sp. N25 TaxID=3129254 RepID=UPI003077519F
MAGSRIEFQDLTLGYDRHPAVHHLSGRIEAGALVAIVGPNGAGKSTLLKGVAGLLEPLGGRLSLDGVDPRDIAYLPQLAEVDRSFPLSVYDFVAMGLWRKAGAFGGIGRGHAARIADAIRAVGLEGFERRSVGTLSGGQMQRTLFARLLLQDSSVILLDEPFNAIDAKTAADLLDLIRRWHAERRTVVTVLHDLETVRRHFPESVLIARELIAWGPTPEVLTPANLLKARRMIEAFDEAAHVCDRGAA